MPILAHHVDANVLCCRGERPLMWLNGHFRFEHPWISRGFDGKVTRKLSTEKTRNFSLVLNYFYLKI